jgi:abortive infection bacteriophage resistance protein
MSVHIEATATYAAVAHWLAFVQAAGHLQLWLLLELITNYDPSRNFTSLSRSENTRLREFNYDFQMFWKYMNTANIP